MKKLTFLSKTALVILLTFGVGQMWGETATFSITGKSGSSSPYTITGTLSGAPTGATASCRSTYNDANQITGSKSQTLTLSGFDGCTISGLSLSVRSNTSSPYKGAATITITINGSSKGSKSVSRPGASYGNQSVTVTSTTVNNSTNVVVTVESTENSFYVQSYTITYTPKPARKVTFDTGTGNPTVAARTEASGGAGITLPTRSDLTPACSSDGWYLYGWATAAYGSSSTTTAPSATLVGYPGMTYFPSSNTTLYAVYAKATGAATAQTLTGSYSSHTGWTISGVATPSTYWVLCTDGTITSPTLPYLGDVTSITFSARTYGGDSYKTIVVKTDGGTSVGSTNATSSSMKSGYSISVSGLTTGGAFVFSSTTTTNNNGPGINNITINYTAAPSVYWSEPTCASCSDDPSIDDAQLNGSISLSSIPVSISSVDAGDDCSLSEYGFVWKANSAPSESDNKTPIGTTSDATSFSGSVTGTFALGTTYYIKGYATNNGDNTTLSTNSLQVTPYKVYYNENGGTGTIADQIVNTGGSVTLSDGTGFSKTGYHITKWAKGSAAGTQYDPSSSSGEITANTEFYAIWAANTYAITLNQNGATTESSPTSVNATYNSSTLSSAITNPEKTDYIFEGWYSGTGGTGDLVISTSGELQANVDGFTGAGGIWTATSNKNVYAKWTEHTYTNYRTTCCENIVEAPEVTGTPTKNSITLNWTNVAGATGYTVTSSGGTPGDVSSDGTARSCVITGLSPNTNYTWSVVATYTTPYCLANTANGNTTTSQVYAVSYNKNGGTIANLPSGGTYAAGEEVTVAAKPDGTVSKGGYTFTGWNTANDGSGEHYDADGSTSFTMPSEAVVLYAEWTGKKNYFIDRMHGNWDGEHTEPTTGYNCYLREGAGYTVPDLSDDDTGSNSCVTGHAHFVGWVASGRIGAQGQLLSDYTIIKGGTVQTAGTDGTIYYAVWAEE